MVGGLILGVFIGIPYAIYKAAKETLEESRK